MIKRVLKKIAFIVGGLMFLAVLFYFISGLLLSCKKPVESAYILLEDWVSYFVIEDASAYIDLNNIDSIFVIGMKNSNTPASLQEIDKTRKLNKYRNTYTLSWNGVLGFEIPTEKLNESITLNVKMRGTRDIKYFPHYEVFVNEHLVGTGFVNERDSVYEFIHTQNTTDSLSYILINFDNDKSNSTGDRNLFISDIDINSIDIDSVSTENFFISNIKKPNVNYVSTLNTFKYYIYDLGYDTSKVKLVEINYDPFNKTLALAKGAKKYFSKTEIENINIITEYAHSRRSYLNFKNCLKENIELGCIPVNIEVKKKPSFYNKMDERVSLLITWVYWWFN